jgi:glycosyltransferase involved in cell wall biosynthesis
MSEATRVRLLWLSKETPDRNGQGGQRRQYFQIALLRRAGVDVTVVTPAGEQSDKSIRELAEVIRFRTRRFGGPHPDPVRLAVRGDFDRMVIAHAESLDLLREYHGKFDMPWLVDFHNVNSRWYAQQGNAMHRSMWRGIEREILSTAAASTTCSKPETAALLEQMPSAAVAEAQNGIELEAWPESALGKRDQHTVAAFGSWWYPPNRSGIEWFVTQVWPAVRKTVPQAVLLIVGPGKPPKEVTDAIDDGVEVVGRVQDLAAFLGRARVVTVPVLQGPGTPVKFAEALASGAAVASTVDAASGNPDAPALMSNDPSELANGIAELLERPDKASRLGTAGRAYALNRCPWDVTQQPLINWVLHGKLEGESSSA